MKKSTISAIAGILVAVVCALVLGIATSWFTNWNAKTWFDNWGQGAEQPDPDAEPPVVDSSVVVTPIEDSASKISLASVRDVTSADTVVLEAMVTPDIAENKAVDWSVSWSENAPLAETATVTDYVTVTPASDGALTATLKCLKAFRGNEIIVTVTTREGEYAAQAVVTFKGFPSSLTVNNNNNATQDLAATGTYSVSLDNIFHDVDDSYKANIKLDGVSVGGTYTSALYIAIDGEDLTDRRDHYDQTKTGASVLDLHTADNVSFANCVSVALNADKTAIEVKFTADLLGMYVEDVSSIFGSWKGVYKGDLAAYADISVICGSLSRTFRVNFTYTATPHKVTLNVSNIEF